jgi:hypothetical protein
MTSQRRRAANRANAKRSTGPRSTSGKSRSSMNALRHGLARPLGAEFDNAVSEMSALITTAADTDLATQVAEAFFGLERVRLVKSAMLAEELRSCTPNLLPLVDCDELSGDRDTPRDDQFARIDRYERRARSRLKSAMRELAAHTLYK